MSLKSPSCLYCGSDIVGRRSDAKYCSHRCTTTAEKRRNRDRNNLSVREQRGPNNGRSASPDYGRNLQRKYAEKERQISGFKDKYAKARALGFRSMLEVKVAKELDEAGVTYEYEPIKIPYTVSGNYVPDIVLPNGIMIEIKGRLTEQDRTKMLAVQRCNPDKDIRFVFQRASTKLTKAKKGSTYAEWATKNNFKWAEGSIPEDWY